MRSRRVSLSNVGIAQNPDSERGWLCRMRKKLSVMRCMVSLFLLMNKPRKNDRVLRYCVLFILQNWYIYYNSRFCFSKTITP